MAGCICGDTFVRDYKVETQIRLIQMVAGIAENRMHWVIGEQSNTFAPNSNDGGKIIQRIGEQTLRKAMSGRHFQQVTRLAKRRLPTHAAQRMRELATGRLPGSFKPKNLDVRIDSMKWSYGVIREDLKRSTSLREALLETRGGAEKLVA
uniref:DUF1018 domain-containing protein n=1 Tax=Echinococcus granulosus TaxID=6210 RepID=A0A068WZH3_ECHGR|nr:hypothetical protein EgrG_000040500 [Echinococcus granulosus]